MNPHEWANLIGRQADADIRTLDGLVGKYHALKELAIQLRVLPHLESNTNRAVDDVSVALTVTSQQLESIERAVDGHYSALRAALIG